MLASLNFSQHKEEHNMGVSENRGIPKWMVYNIIYNGKPISKLMICG